MKIINYIVLISLFLVSCSKVTNPLKEIGFGSRDIKYQADEKVDYGAIVPVIARLKELHVSMNLVIRPRPK